MRLIRFLPAGLGDTKTLRVGDKISTLQVATGAGAMCGTFICDAISFAASGVGERNVVELSSYLA